MEKNREKYQEHFLLDENTVIDYVQETCQYFSDDAKLQAKEIGDGNINYVFRIWDENTGKSLVIKQADKKLKSSGRPLSLYRNKIEAEILRIESLYAPKQVPVIYHYDEKMYALAMEDISAYHNLRKELIQGAIYPNFAQQISDFMVNVLVSTTDVLMDRHEKKEHVKHFINIELCDISEDLVFTEPYNDYKKRNILTKGNERFVGKVLYEDHELQTEVAKLRDSFMNHAQALLHGDLHSGSIFINEKGIKVIDPEFSFYGPIGYDVGNVIGNLFLCWASKLYSCNNDRDFLTWIEQTIIDIFDQFKEKATKKLIEEANCNLYTDAFIASYVQQMMSDAIGMAGTEMIRRVVGDTKVQEIQELAEGKEKIGIERISILTAVNFIKNRERYTCGKMLTEEFIRMKESVIV